MIGYPAGEFRSAIIVRAETALLRWAVRRVDDALTGLGVQSGTMQDFQKLRVWHEARALARRVHEVTGGAHRGQLHQFAQVSQIRRAALSIGANIAEGAAHQSPREFARFLQIALASSTEVEHHAILGVDIGLLRREAADEIVSKSQQVQRMLVALRRRVLGETAEGFR